ncbi:MAG: hypothetical protein ABI986_08285 [Chloroflexota bacterium]
MNKNLSKILLVVGLLVLVSLSCSMLSSLPGSGQLLKDDFSKSDSGWGTGTDSNSSVEYASGGLQMQVFTKNYFIWSTPNKEPYDKVHMEVTVNNNGTDATTAFGLMCYQQAVTSSFYYFAITPAGEYAIAKAAVAVSDVFLTNNDQWTKSDLIAKNAPSYQVGADCGNGTLTLYVDGKQVASVTDSTYTTGNVGVFTWSGEDVASANVTFDDFVLTKLGQ